MTGAKHAIHGGQDLGPAGTFFTSSDVSRIADVSLRQLQWWDERGLISPRQEGHRRFYHLHEVIQILILTDFRRKGLSLAKLRGALRFLKRGMKRHLQEGMENKSDLYLATDLKSFHLEHDTKRIVGLFAKATHPMFLVCVSDHLKRLASESSARQLAQQLKLF